MNQRDQKPPASSPVPVPRQQAERGEDAANQLAGRSGSELPAPVREPLESQFDADFSHVRVHDDRPAAEAANAMGARAFTIGRHIAFNAGEYKPASATGRRLLAHELTHVVQQGGAGAGRAALVRDAAQERAADAAAERASHGLAVQAEAVSASRGPRIQADDKKPEAPQQPAAQAQQAASTTVTIVLRAPDDAYTQDVTDYVRHTLNEQVIEVDNLEEAAGKIAEYAKQNQVKVSNVRIIGHGSTTGGIKMTPKGETGRRFVSAQELEQMAADDKVRSKAKDAMAEGSTVEFWGCYIGGTETSTKSVGQIFNSDVKAIDSTLRTTSDSFLRQADHGETGQKIKGQPGEWIEAISTQEIDFRVKEGNKTLGETFNRWLVTRSKQLEADGDLPPQADDNARIATMRDLFDRSGGKIKRLQIRSGGKNVTRSDKKKWLKQWKTTKK